MGEKKLEVIEAQELTEGSLNDRLVAIADNIGDQEVVSACNKGDWRAIHAVAYSPNATAIIEEFFESIPEGYRIRDALLVYKKSPLAMRTVGYSLLETAKNDKSLESIARVADFYAGLSQPLNAAYSTLSRRIKEGYESKGDWVGNELDHIGLATTLPEKEFNLVLDMFETHQSLKNNLNAFKIVVSLMRGNFAANIHDGRDSIDELLEVREAMVQPIVVEAFDAYAGSGHLYEIVWTIAGFNQLAHRTRSSEVVSAVADLFLKYRNHAQEGVIVELTKETVSICSIHNPNIIMAVANALGKYSDSKDAKEIVQFFQETVKEVKDLSVEYLIGEIAKDALQTSPHDPFLKGYIDYANRLNVQPEAYMLWAANVFMDDRVASTIRTYNSNIRTRKVMNIASLIGGTIPLFGDKYAIKFAERLGQNDVLETVKKYATSKSTDEEKLGKYLGDQFAPIYSAFRAEVNSRRQ